jgi:hypothetical protein
MNLMRPSFSSGLLVLLGACAAPGRIAPSADTGYPDVARVAPRSAERDVALAPPAQSDQPEFDERIAYGGLGFTSSPSSFLLSGGVDFHLDDLWYWGPQLELGLEDDTTLLAPQVNIKRFFELPDIGGDLDLDPFAQAGIGLAYLEKDQRQGDDDDVGVLLNVGGGARLRLSDSFGIGSSLLFNYVPGEVVDEQFYFSWDVIQGVFYF